VTAILRLKGTGNLESIHIIKKPGGALKVRSKAKQQRTQAASCCSLIWVASSDATVSLPTITLLPATAPGTACRAASHCH
jgi:hypothetical protein